MPSRIEPSTTTIKGKTVPVSSFDTISLVQLESGESSAVERLLSAATSSGWFYLDLKGDSPTGKVVIEDVDKVYQISDKYFMQPKESKERDVRTDQKPSQDRGYKTSSCDETFEMARDEVNSGLIKWPATMQNDAPTLARFSNGCHFACQTILAALSSALHLSPDQSFSNHHRENQPSDSGLKLIYEPSLDRLSDVGDNLHTDSGTLTLLFYDKWGLSAHVPSQGFAFPAAPEDGCALINVGDSLQRLSGGKLRSPKHRVSQPVDGAEKRYYLSYFLRPEHKTKEAWAQA
ncbi:MAG: hypothetical protein LQ342_003968 [Letrouitia transgressa]|nr:MAG: hypothetical protein LQ342_003968 [Letrouitia transgressa]